MKIDKLPTQDFNLESKTNGVISDKIFLNLNETSTEKLNGDAMTEDSLLVEVPPALMNGKEDSPFANGSKIEDSISPFNSPSSFTNLELEDELLSDEMTLRLTDDEESPDNAQNEQRISPIASDNDKNLPTSDTAKESAEKTITSDEAANTNDVDTLINNSSEIENKDLQTIENHSNIIEKDDLSAAKSDSPEPVEHINIEETKTDDLELPETDHLALTEDNTNNIETVADEPEISEVNNLGVTEDNAVELNKDDFETAKKDVDDDIETVKKDVDDDIETAKKGVDNNIEIAKKHVDDDVKTAKRDVDDDIETAKKGVDDDIETVKKDVDDDIETAKKGVDNDIEITKKHVDDEIETAKKNVDDDFETTKTDLEDDVEIAKKDMADDFEIANKDVEDNLETVTKEVEDDLETAKKDLEDLLSIESSETKNESDKLIATEVLLDEKPEDKDVNTTEEVNNTDNVNNTEDINKTDNVNNIANADSCNDSTVSKSVSEELVINDNEIQLEADLKSFDIQSSPITSDSLEKTISDLENEIENAELILANSSTRECNVEIQTTLKRKFSTDVDSVENKISKNDASEEIYSANLPQPTTDDAMDVDPVDRVVESDELKSTVDDSETKSDCSSNDDIDVEKLAEEVDKPSEEIENNVNEEKCVKDQTESTGDVSKLNSENEVVVQPLTQQEEKEEIKVSENENVPKEDINKNSTSLKRALDKDDDILVEVKKPKINGLLHEALTIKKPVEYVSLDKLKTFMSGKKIEKMTRADLEEFCLQKMCESINHVSKIGELNHQVKRQEQMLETWRNKYTSLSKQIRDLEVVHHRMLQEVRSKVKEGGNPQDVSPVKITRSVGLQVSIPTMPVRLKPNIESPNVQAGVKRKIQRTSLPNKLPTTPQPIIPTPVPKPVLAPAKSPLVPPKTPQATPPKGIKTILPKVLSGSEVKETTSTNNNTLLGSYLQNNKQNTPTPPIPAAPPARKPATEPAKVIDLTDEDDSNKTASVSSAPTPAPPPTPTPMPTPTGNIRVMAPHQLNTSAANAASTPIVTPSMPRLTYLVQAQGQTGQQLLLATNAGTARPTNIRPTIMFKPLGQGQTQSVGQRLNIVRPGTVPGTMTVVPSTTTQSIRAAQPIRFAPTTVTSATLNRNHVMSTRFAPQRHPAPLPPMSNDQGSQPRWKAIPPKPSLKISRVGDGIVLSWKIINKDMSLCEEIASYQLYAYQETNAAPSTDMWRKVGDVKALALPMACTLTQFTDGNKYHFAVRAVDVKSRVGPFSQPEQISLPTVFKIMY